MLFLLSPFIDSLYTNSISSSLIFLSTFDIILLKSISTDLSSKLSANSNNNFKIVILASKSPLFVQLQINFISSSLNSFFERSNLTISVDLLII